MRVYFKMATQVIAKKIANVVRTKAPESQQIRETLIRNYRPLPGNASTVAKLGTAGVPV